MGTAVPRGWGMVLLVGEILVVELTLLMARASGIAALGGTMGNQWMTPMMVGTM